MINLCKQSWPLLARVSLSDTFQNQRQRSSPWAAQHGHRSHDLSLLPLTPPSPRAPLPAQPGGGPQLWPLWEPSQTFRSSRHVLWHLTFDLPHVCEEAGSRPPVCLVTWPLIGCPASSIGSPKPMTAGATVNYSVLLAGNTAYWKPVKSFTSNHDVLILVLLCGCKAFNLINCVFLSQVLN